MYINVFTKLSYLHVNKGNYVIKHIGQMYESKNKWRKKQNKKKNLRILMKALKRRNKMMNLCIKRFNLNTK